MSDTKELTAQNPDRFIEMAIEKGADVDQLAKLMDLKERWDAKQAKMAFDKAMSDFQAKCPTLKKTKTVKFNNVEYSYAPLSSIRDQIQPHLTSCGLSYRWEITEHEVSGQNDAAIAVRCIITHGQGHSESTEFAAYADDSGAKNEIQQRGSTLSYMQRYTLIGALGITSADTDDDGKSSGALNIEKIKAHTLAVRENFHSVYIIKQALADKDFGVAAEAFAELDRETRNALWLAPTKGGIFTTEERDTLKSKDFRDIISQHDPSYGRHDPTEGVPAP